MITQIAPLGIVSIGWCVFIAFVVIDALSAPTVYVFFPETMVRNL